MSSDEHEPRSIYLFGSANALVNIAYVYSSLCKSAQSVCSFCVKNGLVSSIISSASVFIQPAHPLSMNYSFLSEFMIALKTSEMSGGFKVLDREARIRPGTNKSQTFGLFLVHSQRIRTRLGPIAQPYLCK